MANPFDQFDSQGGTATAVQANPFDQFDQGAPQQQPAKWEIPASLKDPALVSNADLARLTPEQQRQWYNEVYEPSQQGFLGQIEKLKNAFFYPGMQTISDAAPAVARIAPPIAAAILSEGASIPAQMAATASAGAAGGMAANTMEGKPAVQSPQEVMANAIGGMAGMSGVAPEASMLERILGGASEGMAVPAAQAAAQGRAPTAKELALGAALGSSGRGIQGMMAGKAASGGSEASNALETPGNALSAQDERTIQQIAKSTGRDAALVRADYLKERGLTEGVSDAVQEQSAEQPLLQPEGAGDGQGMELQGVGQQDQLQQTPAAQGEEGAVKSAEDSAGVFNEALPQPPAKSAYDSARIFLSVDDPVGSAAQVSKIEANAPEEVKSAITNTLLDPSFESGNLSPEAERYLNMSAGNIDPRLMLALGRTAIGGAIGYQFGDTDEEKLKNAAIGAGLAFGVPILGQMLGRTAYGQQVMQAVAEEKQNFWKQADPLMLLPSKITSPGGAITPLRDLMRETIQSGADAIKGIQYQANAISKDLQQAIDSNASKQLSSDQLKDRVYQYLTGDPATKLQVAPTLPSEVYAQTLRSRYFIDELSDQAVASGAVTGNMAQTFLSNKGQYLRRSYELFQNPNFTVDEVERQSAIDAVHRQLAQQAIATASLAPTRDAAEEIINTLLNKQTAEPFMLGATKVAGKDVSVLMQRQDLLPEVKQMMGEIQDPVYAVNESGSRMAKLLENDRVQKNIAKIGQQAGIFSNQRLGKFITPLASDGSKAFNNFSGLYAEPHIAQAFQQVAGQGRIEGIGGYMGNLLSPRGAAAQILALPNYAAKFAQTGLNVSLIVPRYLHGMFANVGNGNFRFDQQAQGLALGAEETGLLRRVFPTSPSRAALQAEVSFLTKKGVLGQNLVREDFMDLLDTGLWQKLRKGVGGIGAMATTPNMLADNMNRYTAFKSEQAKLFDALPNANQAILTDMAANRVRDTLPTYSQIPNVVRGASRIGLLNTFVSFPYELTRNTLNSYKIGYQDIRQGMQQGNAKLVRMGATRIAGMTAVLGAASAFGASAMSKKLNGVSDQQDRDLRTLLPSWLKTRELIYTKPVRGGQASYANLSYLLPYADLMAPINQGIREIQQTGDFKSPLPPVLDALKEQWIGTPMVLSAWAGAVLGRDPSTGKTISPIGAPATAADRAAYLWDKAYEPEILRWAQNTAKGLDNQEGNYGQKFDLDNQMWRIGGVRAQTTDIANNLNFRLRDLGNQIDDIEAQYRANAKKGLPPDQLQGLYSQAEAQRKSLVGQMSQAYGAGTRLLYDAGGNEKVLQAMKQARIDPRTILDVADGNYTPMQQTGKPSAVQLYAQMQSLSRDAQMTKLAQVYRDDPTLGRTIMGLFKQDVRGLDEKDKIVASLGVENGERAEYIKQRMAQMPTPLAQQSFLYSMASKKILTKEVMQQLAK